MSRVILAPGRAQLITGDAAAVLAGMPDNTMDCVVTAPPSWRGRGNGWWFDTAGSCPRHTRQPPWLPRPYCAGCGANVANAQLGREPTLDNYIDRIVDVFTELRRVLVPDGTAWLILGDQHVSRRTGRVSLVAPPDDATAPRPLLDHKNLIGQPWRVAFALQSNGWYVRNAIVWNQPTGRSEPVADRLTGRYRMLFLLTRSRDYWFDLDAIRDPNPPTSPGTTPRWARSSVRTRASTRGRNPGDVWTTTHRLPTDAAVAIASRAIRAGCKPGGTVCDPFSGDASTGVAAQTCGRWYLGIDLHADRHLIAGYRLARAWASTRPRHDASADSLSSDHGNASQPTTPAPHGSPRHSNPHSPDLPHSTKER